MHNTTMPRGKHSPQWTFLKGNALRTHSTICRFCRTRTSRQVPVYVKFTERLSRRPNPPPSRFSPLSLWCGSFHIFLRLARTMANLRLQKRLAAAVLKCGKKRVWLDPNESSELSMANSSTQFFFYTHILGFKHFLAWYPCVIAHY